MACDRVTALLPHALQGMGGVGKTQLAVEYCYRYQADYGLVWWVPADQPALARPTLAALAPRLSLTGIALTRVEDSVAAVLDALRQGKPYRDWLLVFDNADQPESIRDLMPEGPGHVLVTSRNQVWASVADTLDVDVFARPESLEFLRRRAPHIADADDDRLAEDLGDLPLALEQAGALLAETAMPINTYLDLLQQEASRILDEGRPADYPVPVAAAWSLAVRRIRDETPRAMHLLQRCAFLGPEPIRVAMLDQGRHAIAPPLAELLSDPLLMSRAIRALGRYALARIDNQQRTIQVHRIIQKVIRDELGAEESMKIRREVHQLLAAADPGDPDEPDNWPKYADLLAHAGPARVLKSDEPHSRRLVKNIVRYLYVAANYSDAQRYAERALDQWTTDSGEDHPDVLVMRRHLGLVLWAIGEYEAAYNLNRENLDCMREVLGRDHEETLILINGHGADLRARGEFAAARKLDEDSLERHRDVFGDDHLRTFMAANNLALDYRITGEYQKALELEYGNYQARLDFFGRDNHPQVLFSLDNLARALRHTGDHVEARKLAERVYKGYQDAVKHHVLPADHPSVLSQAKSLSIIRRMSGAYAEAAKLAAEVYDRYRRTEGMDHPDTLSAATSYGNARRLTGDLDSSAALLEDTAKRYQAVLGADHPFTHGAFLNLAVARRLLGDAEGARVLLQGALVNLERSLGPEHDSALICAVNLASVYVDLGETGKARELGEATLRRLRSSLGEDNPHTLACAANLALDLRAEGLDHAAAQLTADTLDRYSKLVGLNYPDALAAAQGKRVDLDFDPPPL